MKFSSFPTNAHICAQISRLMEAGRFPHAALLEGGSAEERKALGRLIAQALVCTASKGRPCGKCAACQKAAAQSHPDIWEAEGGEAARSFHIDTVRAVREDTAVLPNEAERKVYLLLNAQSMSAQAQNALLKVLEEPPSYAFFLLACDSKTKMLPTILSRVAIFTLEASGQELSAPTGKKEQKRNELSAQMARAVVAPAEFPLLALSGKLEKDKDLTAACLARMALLFREALRISCGMASSEEDARYLAGALTQERLLAVMKAIDALSLSLLRNANQNLLLTRLCSTLRRAAGK
ncbi:MAG TPA: ATP-binding protein [Candidatus Fimivicinus intestinavium]|nr:ATP-binding protein [Candidatus Fimivicinus intestinavium]